MHAHSLISIPLSYELVSAGFPSPATDYIDGSIDLNRELVAHPSATFCVRATGRSMEDVGIFAGSLLLVDRALEPHAGDIVLACVEGEFLVKKLTQQSHFSNNKKTSTPLNNLHPTWLLEAQNSQLQFAPIPVTQEVEIWGVVITVINQFPNGQTG